MYKRLMLVLILHFVPSATAAEAKTTLTMGVVDPNIVGQIQFLLNRLTSNEADLEFKVVAYPRERLLVELNRGNIDGDASRYLEARPQLEKKYPDIRMLTEPLLTIDWVLITAAKAAPVKPLMLPDVKNRRFAIPRGSLVGENLFANVQLTTNDLQAVDMLIAGRVDHIIGSRVFGRLVLPGHLPDGLIVQEEPLLQSRLTLCFHKKHAGLLPRLDSLIRRAREQNLFRKWAAELQTSGPESK